MLNSYINPNQTGRGPGPSLDILRNKSVTQDALTVKFSENVLSLTAQLFRPNWECPIAHAYGLKATPL